MLSKKIADTASRMEAMQKKLDEILREHTVFGRNNDRHFFGFISYEFNQRLPLRVAGLLCLWLGLEVREGWRSWFVRAKSPAATATPLGVNPVPYQTQT